MLSLGSWWVRSKKDPRWNARGRGAVGMFGMPKDAKEWVDRCKLQFGEQPDDLEFEYMKD